MLKEVGKKDDLDENKMSELFHNVVKDHKKFDGEDDGESFKHYDVSKEDFCDYVKGKDRKDSDKSSSDKTEADSKWFRFFVKNITFNLFKILI